MDEKLIKSVKKFPCIWKMSSEFYKCNDTKDAAWDQIIIETNISDVKTAKSRWKQLRDNHRDALKRQNATRSGQARKQRKEWKYQKAMSFLLPYMSNRDGSSNFAPLDDSVSESSNPPNTIDESSRESCNLLPSSSNNIPSVNVSNDSTASRPLPSISRKRKNDDILQEHRELLERERIEVKNNISASDKYDEIDLFFFNLAASTKKLPYYLQLQIKKACFNAVMSAEESNLQQCWYSPNKAACPLKRSKAAERRNREILINNPCPLERSEDFMQSYWLKCLRFSAPQPRSESMDRQPNYGYSTCTTPTPDNINTSINTPSAPDNINTIINTPSASQIQATKEIETEQIGPNENADNIETMIL